MSLKSKMPNRTLRAILIPIIAITTITLIVVDFEMNLYSSSLDTYLGRGERHFSSSLDTTGWDTNYYQQDFTSDSDSRANGEAVCKQLTDEGLVLLKNDGTLPLTTTSKVAPFGYSYLYPIYGGTGSGSSSTTDSITPEEALKSDFVVNEAAVKCMEEAEATSPNAATGTSPVTTSGDLGTRDFSINGYDPDIYSSVIDQFSDSVGLVFIGRKGGEGADLKKDGYDDGTPHFLALSENEKKTILFAKSHCKKTIVILNSSNVMQVADLLSGDYAVNSILWIGGPGSRGFQSMADILCGKVNPSGKTVDIWPSDLTKDPTYSNFGEYAYSNAFLPGSSTTSMHFSEYEEGVYLGYRYYETASDLGAFDYSLSVAYPFGYGLSYTSFSQSIKSFSSNGDDVDMVVTVANTGSVAGKDTVEAYYSSPYTSYDETEGIEKPTANLIAFGKTSLLAAGASEDITLTFAKEDMASYDEAHDNGDGTLGCYLLEGAAYVVSLRTDSHTVVDSKTINVDSSIFYCGDNLRASDKKAQSALDANGNSLGYPAKAEENSSASYVAATNEFQECTDYMKAGKATNLSRSNWTGTFPTAPLASDFTASSAVIEGLQGFDYASDKKLGNIEGSKVYQKEAPTSNASNNLTLSSLRGKDFYDGAYSKLLDQLTYQGEGLSEIEKLLFLGAYETSEITAIGKSATLDIDGPAGLNRYDAPAIKFCSYCSEVVIASTWNTVLAKAMGEAVGQEALTSGVNGWYGPAMNLHRSPFGGRNFEYYSEDALLSGEVAASVCSGAGEEGLYPYIKHFALNESETDRDTTCVWATEQAIRELYLKPFEICIKTAKSLEKYTSDSAGTLSTKVICPVGAVMLGKNYIGTTGCYDDYSLLTNVLRYEWGFNGIAETDMAHENAYTPGRQDKVIRAGADIWMAYSSTGTGYSVADDLVSPTAQWCIRNAVHHVAYTVANSNAMQDVAPGSIVSYDMSPWKIWMIAINVVIWMADIGLLAWMVVRTANEKKHLNTYKRKAGKGDNVK